MITIREYREEDAEEVGVLIADTYGAYNLTFAPAAERGPFLGPFEHASSPDAAHREAIAAAIRAPMVFVAQGEEGEIVGVLRGGRIDGRGRTVLMSLFVLGARQRQGIGRALVERFEAVCRQRGDTVIRLAATLYAVPFYLAMGYKKSTGLRTLHSFGAAGSFYQPMKKLLRG